jgi:hypothetical protein
MDKKPGRKAKTQYDVSDGKADPVFLKKSRFEFHSQTVLN